MYILKENLYYGECVNFAISQQQLQLFINYSKLFKDQLQTFAIARETFGTSTFSKQLLFRKNFRLASTRAKITFSEQLVVLNSSCILIINSW